MALQLRLRGPGKQHTASLVAEATFGELVREAAHAFSIPESDVEVLLGFPPAVCSASADTPLADLVKSGDSATVRQGTGGPATQASSSEAFVPAAGQAASALLQTIDQGTSSGIEDAMNLAITTQAEWEGLWGRHASISSPPAPVPAVDFSTEMVLCVFWGIRSSGGYTVKIKGIEKGAVVWKVSCETTSPGGGMTTGALTQPFHMVRVEKTDVAMDFSFHDAAPTLVKQLVYNITVEADKTKEVGDKLPTLPGVTSTNPMFQGKIVTVRFDASAVDADIAAATLSSILGVKSVEL